MFKIENYKIKQYNTYIKDNKITDSLINCMISSNLFKNKELAEQDLIEEINKWEKYFIAIEDWEVIGFVSWWPRNIHNRRGEYELFHIWTTKKGIAKILFNHFIEDAKVHYRNLNSYLRKLYLFTSRSNINAHWFYENLWMNITGLSIDKFWKNKNEIEYSLIFDSHWEKTKTSLTITKNELLKIFW